MPEYDAAIVGSGPNGLAAAITLARDGRSVAVVEGHSIPGGGMRSSELTLPGFVHDECASVVPLAAASPFFATLPLARYGLSFVQPEIPLAHPLGDEEAVVLRRSIAATAAGLAEDGGRWSRLMAPLVEGQEAILGDLLGPLRIPRRPLIAARFGLPALLPATSFARGYFGGRRARALFAGLAAHSMLPLERPGSSAVALVLAMLGHASGWPFVATGASALADALVSCLRSHGGRLETGRWIADLEELPSSRVILLDLTPGPLLRVSGGRFSGPYRKQLGRYRYGPGVCKVDFALQEPIPWLARDCRRAGTVHLGGSAEEIAEAERTVWRGEHPERPFVIVTQPSLFDPSRAPPGRHTAWAYCHVPHGSGRDVSGIIERQIERFAPGFRESILARSVRTAAELERYDPNYVGGDINGGVQDLGQMFTRPTLSLTPYATSDPRIFICSSATPPGGGVHGLCGSRAARFALAALARA